MIAAPTHRAHAVVTLAMMAALAVVTVVSGAAAESKPYPDRIVKLVVGFAAGGGNDIIARVVGQKLEERLGQPVIVENKPGAGGTVAALAVRAAPPDGYTLLLGASGAMSITPAISVRPPYATLRDFVPVSNLVSFPLVLSVYAGHPAQNLADLVAWLKANPDRSNYATCSPSFTLATELFKMRSGAPATAIPYKSSGEMVVAVMARQSVFAIADPPPTTTQVRSGEVRALAVTSDTRLAELPEVPTMAEAGLPGVDVALWSGVFVPAGTPAAVVARLEAELRAIMQSEDVKARFRTLGTPVLGSTAAEFAHQIDAETRMWAEVGRAANVKLE